MSTLFKKLNITVHISAYYCNYIICLLICYITDINENGITLVTRESYFKKNYLFNASNEEKSVFQDLLSEAVLLNLRTYDQHSLVLHANDHLNNFVQLYINNGNSMVFLFNYGDMIYNITVEYPGLLNFVEYQCLCF